MRFRVVQKKIIFFILILIVVGIIPQSFAHTAKIAGDFKIDVGWNKEPPIENEQNAIEIIITLASSYDKQRFDKATVFPAGDIESKAKLNDVSGLAEKLEVDVKLGDSKESITLFEDSEIPGLYHGKYTPNDSGKPNIHIFGQIGNIEFEATFHPEKVESNSHQVDEAPKSEFSVVIPSWIKTNAGWWADGQIDDNTFIQGIQFLIQQEIIEISQKQQKQEPESNGIPDWIKNNAGWWSQDLISDDDFLKGIQYLVEQGIIKV